MFLRSKRHAVTTNDNVFHLIELGRSHRSGTGCNRVCFVDVGHICVLPVWRWAVTTGKNYLQISTQHTVVSYGILHFYLFSFNIVQPIRKLQKVTTSSVTLCTAVVHIFNKTCNVRVTKY